MKFSYQDQKFSQARSCLMLPHSLGEAESIAQAFHECSLGLHGLDKDSLDDSARSLVNKLEELMKTDGVDESQESGTWQIRAEKYSNDQKLDLANIIDDLAHWFGREDT